VRRTAEAFGNDGVQETLRDQLRECAFLEGQHELGIDPLTKRHHCVCQFSDRGLILEAGESAHEHKPADALGIIRRDLKRDRGAHGMADDDGAFDTEDVEQSAYVGRHVGDGVA